MDDDTQDLAIQLCIQIGMMMVDTSAIALTIGSLEPSDQPTAVLGIERASGQIDALESALLV